MNEEIRIEVVKSSQGFDNYKFTGKLTEEIKSYLKENGYFWSRRNQCYYPATADAKSANKTFTQKLESRFFSKKETSLTQDIIEIEKRKERYFENQRKKQIAKDEKFHSDDKTVQLEDLIADLRAQLEIQKQKIAELEKSNKVLEEKLGKENLRKDIAESLTNSRSGVIPKKSEPQKEGAVQEKHTKRELSQIREKCREILKKSDSEITEDDKKILSQYEGAGGLNEANRSVNGVLNEYYTPKNLVDKVWKIVDHYAPDAKTVLEPSAGIGKFAVNRPQNDFTMHELDETSARIAKILHPDANVIQGAYQKQFFDEGGRVRKTDFEQPKYDVVIGNPPYGKYNDKYKGLGEGKEFDRYEEYFISKGLDALKDEKSVLAFVVPSGFLKSANDNQKKIIAEKGELIDAYRLPEGTFGTTDVGTDILVMRNWEAKKQKLNENARDNAAFQKLELQSRMAKEAFNLSGDQWFKNHPEKILGKTVEFTDRFGKPATKVVAEEGMTVQDELNKIDEFVTGNDVAKEFANANQNVQSEKKSSEQEVVSPEEINEEKKSVQEKVQQLKNELDNPENAEEYAAYPKEKQEVLETIEKFERLSDEDIKNQAIWKKENQRRNEETRNQVAKDMEEIRQKANAAQKGELLSYNETHPAFTLSNKETGRQTSIQPSGKLEENVKKLGKLDTLIEAENVIEKIKSQGFEILSTEYRVVIYNDDKFYDFDSYADLGKFNYETKSFDYNFDSRKLNGWDFKNYIDGGLKITKSMKDFEKIPAENEKTPEEIADQLERMEVNIRNENGWISANDIVFHNGNARKYISEIKERMTVEAKAAKLTDQVFSNLEADNYHTLNDALGILGAYGTNYQQKVLEKLEKRPSRFLLPYDVAKEFANANQNVQSEEITEKSSAQQITLTQKELSLAESVIPKDEYSTMLEYAASGEESDFYKQKIKDIAVAVKNAPKLYETDGQDEHKIVLRYFHPAGTESYITEIGDDGEAFGFTCVNGDWQNAEWGYISINELKNFPMMETDLYVQDGMSVERYLGKEHPDIFPEYAKVAEKAEKKIEQDSSEKIAESLEKVQNEKLDEAVRNAGGRTEKVFGSLKSAENANRVALELDGQSQKLDEIERAFELADKEETKPKSYAKKPQNSKQHIAKSKGEVMTAEEFSRLYGKNFDEREFPIWKATDWQGNIDLSKLTDADKAYLSESKNYVQKNFGEWTHKELFTTGDIYAKIEEQKNLFEKSGHNALFAENIKLLEGAKKPELSMERIHFGVKTSLAEEFTVPQVDADGNKVELNLQESFILWAQNRTLENQDGRSWIDFATANISREELPENVFWGDIVNYIDGTPVKAEAVRGWRTWDMSEEEKKAEKAERKREADLKRQARSDAADRLFDRYLHEGLDEKTRARLVTEYNRRFNSYIIPDYSKLPLFVDGMSAYKGETKFKLYDQQIKGISFLCNKGNGLLAYDVGVGKTAAGIVATVNQIQTGRSKRPLIVVPNQVYAKWYTDIRELFPAIKVNDLYNFNQESVGKYVDEKNPHKLNIPENSISLCTYEALKNITFTDKSCENELYEDFSNLLSADFDGSDRENAESADKIKGIIGAASHVKDSSYYFFEEAGFDNLTVDEAHNFKNLWVVPRPKKKGASNEYSGIPSGKPSARALKLYGMTQLTQRNNDDRNVFLLTATPFTNSPTEVYSMLSYIGRKRLQESGLSSLRSFFDEFAKTKQELGVTSSGNIDTKQVMKNWKELPALQNILTEFIDKIDGEEAGIIRPNKFTHVKPLDMSPLQKQMREIDEERMAEVKEGNSAAVIVAMNNMRLSCVAPALANPAMYPDVELPPLSQLVETSPKLKFVCDAIIDMYKGNPEKGQFMYVPLGKESHGIIKDYLVAHGIPKDAVEIINGEVNNTPEKKEKITAKFNDEKNPLKILIGGKNTSEGIDLNGNSFVMYNCSLGWNPSETIQSEGRIWRQGNLQGNVHIVYPVMNDSIDSVLYQKHDEKRSRINELWSYKGDSLNVEDINPEDLKIELIKDPEKKAKLILNEKTKESRAELSRTELKIRSFDEIIERRKTLNDDFENAKDMLESYKSQSERYKAEGLEVPEWIKTSVKDYTKQQKQAEAKLEVINEKLESLGIRNDDDTMKYIRSLNTQKKVTEEKIKNIEKEMPEIIRKLQKERLEQKLTEYPVEKQREILEADILNNLRPMKEVEYEVKTMRFEKMISQKLKANDITQEEFDLYKKAGFENYEKWRNGEIESLENQVPAKESDRHVSVETKTETEKAEQDAPLQNSAAQTEKTETKQKAETPARKSKKNAEQKSIYEDEGSLFFGMADEKLVVASTEQGYSKSSEKTFAEQVDEVLAGTYDRFNALKVSDTPQILLDVGCKQLPILYTQNHLKNAMHAKSSNNPNYHGLTAEQIKQLPELLAKPAILMDSLSNANSDSLVAVLNAVDNDNAPLFAVIKPNGFGTYEYELVDSNFMLSVYGKDNGFEKYIENAVRQDKILFWDKKESQALFSVLQLQLPQGLNKLDSDKILHQSNSLVNPNVVRSPKKNYFNSRNDDFSLSESQLLKSEQKRDEIIFPVLNGKESGMYKAFNDFARRGVFDVQGTKVDVSDGNGITETGWNQLHAAMNIYRSKEFETMRYVFIDRKSGEIRDQMALTSHMPNYCAVSDFAGKSIEEIKRRAKETNCIVAACHNHPSGNVTESRQDAEFTALLEKELNSDGKNLFAGHIILDHGTFNLYTSEKGWTETFDFSEIRKDDGLLNKNFEFSEERTETTRGLENIARKINGIGNWSDNFVPVVFSTAENEVTGIKLYDKSFFDKSPQQIRNEFQFSGIEAGAVKAFPVFTKNLEQSLSAIDAMMLEEKMKNLVHQNAFTDAALPESTVVEKYNIRPGLPFFDGKNYKAKNPEIQTTWETRINPNLFTEKSEFSNQKEQMNPRQFQRQRLKKAAGMEY